MRENSDLLILLMVSVIYLKENRLSDAADLYDEGAFVRWEYLNKNEKIQCLKSLYVWAKLINSESAREKIRSFNIDKRRPAELHYYILSLKKTAMYPLLIFTWFFA